MLKVCAAVALVMTSSLAKAETVDDVARRYHLAGEVLVAKGDHVVVHHAYGTVSPTGGSRHRVGERWRYASITKQVTAALLLRDVDLSALDIPIAPGWPTRRQLLTHHSGLANPDDTAVRDGVPSFYTRSAPDLSYCRSKPPRPGASFSYNNCDYLTLRPGSWAWPTGMRMARQDERGVPGFIAGKPEPKFQLASYGAAGGLVGTVQSLFAFDRALMTGGILPGSKLEQLWKPEGNGSYQALGQWVFPGALKGCNAPKRIVQRDGEILGVQARNYILPDDDTVVIVFTNRSSDDFVIGEIWQQTGFAYDLMSAAVCG